VIAQDEPTIGAEITNDALPLVEIERDPLVIVTQTASCRAMWTALWIVKPAGLTRCGLASTFRPSTSILTSEEAAISSQR
jgi:hypothetical protein